MPPRSPASLFCVSDPLWLQWLTMQVWCTPGPSLCSSCLFWNDQKSVCEPVWGSLLPKCSLEECGGARMRWTSLRGRLLRAAAQIGDEWLNWSPGSRISWGATLSKSRCLSTSEVKLARYHPWFSEHLWRRKSPLGGEEGGGRIDPRSENWMWISMATSEENLQYFKSRYHVMFQLGHMWDILPEKRRAMFSDLNSAEWVFHDSSRDSGVQELMLKSIVLAVRINQELSRIVRRQNTTEPISGNHPRTRHIKTFISHHWNKVQTSLFWKIPKSYALVCRVIKIVPDKFWSIFWIIAGFL